MNFNWKRKLGSLFLSVAVAACAIPVIPVYADGSLEVVFEDITETDPNVLQGEAKIQVSVRGVSGEVSIAQTYMIFEGDLKYKAIEFLQGSNNYEQKQMLVTPNAALANATGEIETSIISAGTEIPYFNEGEDTAIFILTFKGNPGEKVTLSLNDNLESTYCKIDGEKLTAISDNTIEVTASDKTNTGKQAVVKLTMDQVTSFASGENDYSDSRVNLTITSETNPRYSFYTVLNNELINDEGTGGHRDGTQSFPTFIVENTVLDGDTYTIELAGPGYTTYTQTGVTFDEPVEIDNSMFVPGDINSDGIVDVEDKKLGLKAVDDISIMENYEGAPDLNRTGAVDRHDVAIFEAIPGDITEDESTEDDNTGDNTENDNPGGDKPGEGSGDSTTDNDKDDTTGKEEENDKDKEDEDKEEDKEDNKKPSTNKKPTSGGGGGGGGGGSTSVKPTTPSTGDNNVNTPSNQVEKVFTDLGNHEWAEEAIYTLKGKGMINGISDTEYAPANNIKRGDFILILTRMLGIDNVFDENFADVPEDMYYYNAIGSAKAAGIAKGSGENFMPEDTITRQDLITLAYRAFVSLGYLEEQTDTSTENLDSFADKALIDDYALSALNVMVGEGIIQGSDGNVNPKGYATRAEVAVMCSRLLNIMK